MLREYSVLRMLEGTDYRRSTRHSVTLLRAVRENSEMRGTHVDPWTFLARTPACSLLGPRAFWSWSSLLRRRLTYLMAQILLPESCATLAYHTDVVGHAGPLLCSQIFPLE